MSEPPPAPAPRTTPELPPLPGEAEGDDLPPAAEQPDWIERINSIPDAKAKGACMKQFRATFGGTQVPPGHEQEAAELIASFDGPAVEDEREKLRRGLMAQSTKAFPPDGSLPPKERTAKQAEQRHAVTYAVLGEFKSSNQMDVDELSKVTFWLHDVERGVVKVIQRDGVWVVEFNGGIVEVPPETLVLS